MAGITPVIRSTSGSERHHFASSPSGSLWQTLPVSLIVRMQIIDWHAGINMHNIGFIFVCENSSIHFKALFKCLCFRGVQLKAEANSRNASVRRDGDPRRHEDNMWTPHQTDSASNLGFSMCEVTAVIKVNGFQNQHSSFKDKDMAREGASLNKLLWRIVRKKATTEEDPGD